jgi:hypothetical protein
LRGVRTGGWFLVSTTHHQRNSVSVQQQYFQFSEPRRNPHQIVFFVRGVLFSP